MSNAILAAASEMDELQEQVVRLRAQNGKLRSVNASNADELSRLYSKVDSLTRECSSLRSELTVAQSALNVSGNAILEALNKLNKGADDGTVHPQPRRVGSHGGADSGRRINSDDRLPVNPPFGAKA